ncbi:hypothetical protein [Variovorax sp. MHTC-1]|uniref:hypothetical protein n=1 Tax=Variovorax sp. MHTC-1 TaxID=2495593 RepID=UPI000F888D10|nr:hypothetical protein [Variovorax sp. MHTC-1]RST55955.1 hypothetical protein EJI01_04115 [Variovorax sp. MHTC-1]
MTVHCIVTTNPPPAGSTGIATPAVLIRLVTGTVAPGQIAPPPAVQVAVELGVVQSRREALCW